MFRRLLPAVLIALFVSSSVMGDDEGSGSEPWLIVERCILYPVQAPPADWHYDGTILINGYAGIHGMQQDWDVPRVIAPLGVDSEGNYPIPAGQVSPDGRWYAVPYGTTTLDDFTMNLYWSAASISVFDLSNQNETIRFTPQNILDLDIVFPLGAWVYRPVEWIDDQALVFGDWYSSLTSQIDTLSAVPSIAYALASEVSFNNVNVPSPDRTLMIESNMLLSLPEQEQVAVLPGLNWISWRRDSAGFIAQVIQDEQSTLVLYNRRGEAQETIFELGDGTIEQRDTDERNRIRGRRQFPARLTSGRYDLQWSRDNRYYAFARQSYPEPDTLFIADIQTRTVYNTCIQTQDQPVWSPHQDMFAFLFQPYAQRNYQIVVFDVATWQVYRVGWQLGETTPTTFLWR